MPKSSTKLAVTKGDFDEAMHMIARSFDKVATKDDLKRFATKEDLKRFATKDDFKRIEKRLDNVERVQKSMLKILESIEGRLVDLADHEERITHLEDRIFQLENQLQKALQK